MPDDQMKIMICAGDVSGDKYGAGLAGAVKKERPDCKVYSLGGKNLRSISDSFVYPLADISLMGFWEPLEHIFELKKALDDAAKCLAEEKIKLLVLIDYYGFNIRLAEKASEIGVPVYYFVSPQIWATRYNRIKKLRKYVKKMFVIFPFEEKMYAEEGVSAEFVGHPISESINAGRDGSFPGGNQWKIGLLPGSRTNEVKSHLPTLLESAAALKFFYPNIKYFLFLSPNISDEFVKKYGFPKNAEIEIVRESDYKARSSLDIAWSCSGTAVLENAFLGVPCICFYRTGWINFIIAKSLIKVDYIAMPNILAGRRVVPELIQVDFSGRNLVRLTMDYIKNPDLLAKMHCDFKNVTADLRVRNFYGSLAKRILK